MDAGPEPGPVDVFAHVALRAAVVHDDGHVLRVNPRWEQWAADDPALAVGVDLTRLSERLGAPDLAAAVTSSGESDLDRFVVPARDPNAPERATAIGGFRVLDHPWTIITLEGGVFLPVDRASGSDLEQRYEAVVAALEQGVVLQAATGEVLACNASAERILGLSADQMNGRSSNDPRWGTVDMAGKDLPGHDHPAMRALRAGEPVLGETLGIHRPDGTLRWLRVNARPLLRHGHDRPHAVVTTFTDITSERDSLLSLQTLSARLTGLIKSMHDAVLLEDEDRRIVVTNEAMTDLFGIPASPAELEGEDCSRAAEQAQHLFADPGGFVARVDEILTERVPVQDEELEMADGRCLERSYTPVHVDGSYRGHLWLYRDITRRREVQVQAGAARDAAIRASELKSEFVATVSHELRTPLHSLVGAVELLGGEDLEPAHRRLLQVMQTSATSLRHLVDSVLDFARLESGHADLFVEDGVDPVGIAQDTLGLFAIEAQDKDLELRLTVSPGVPRSVVADARRLRQILVNVIGNAVKFTPSGWIEVTVDSSRDGTGTVQFRVEDTGPGIPADRRDDIFEPFTQVRPRQVRGTGLGLAITSRLAVELGGTIALEPSQSGAVFVIDLPLDVRAAAGVDTGADVVDADAPGERRRVLVVEDDEMVGTVLRMQLDRIGHDVTVVVDGDLAVERVREGGIDVVLMDRHLARMDGPEAAETIRGLAGPERDVPIIALTAAATVEDRQRCLDAGMDGYLTKPVALDDLAVAVATARRTEPTAEDTDAEQAKADRLVSESIAAALGALTQEMGGRSEPVQRAVSAFLEAIDGLVTTIGESDDEEAVRQAAHRLKGSARTLGAAALGDAAAAVEAEPNPTADGHPERVAALRTSAAAAGAAMRAYIAAGSPIR